MTFTTPPGAGLVPLPKATFGVSAHLLAPTRSVSAAARASPSAVPEFWAMDAALAASLAAPFDLTLRLDDPAQGDQHRHEQHQDRSEDHQFDGQGSAVGPARGPAAEA